MPGRVDRHGRPANPSQATDHRTPVRLSEWTAPARRTDAGDTVRQAGRCAGAAAQLAAVHRTLRHGPTLQRQAPGAAADTRPAAAPKTAAANRTGLPDRLKAGVEALSGISLDEVKVHYNSSKPAQLHALAFAQGCDIHLAPGQERHLPHEAWHVVQQAQGRVKPTMQMTGDALVNDDPRLENEADAMGARSLTSKQEHHAPLPLPILPKHDVIQPVFEWLFKLFRRAPKVQFPGVTPGSQEPRVGFNKLTKKFSGYNMNARFEANADADSDVTINYVEKTQEARGFGQLFKDLEAGASQVGSTGIKVSFVECKPEVVRKVSDHGRAQGFEIYDFEAPTDVVGTGPTIRLRKSISKEKAGGDDGSSGSV